MIWVNLCRKYIQNNLYVRETQTGSQTIQIICTHTTWFEKMYTENMYTLGFEIIYCDEIYIY